MHRQTDRQFRYKCNSASNLIYSCPSECNEESVRFGIKAISESKTDPSDSPQNDKKRQQNNSFSKKKAGFTLAEVLITLTIIGIIASYTIPDLVSSFTENANTARAKKAYSLMAQAWDQYREDRGGSVIGFGSRQNLKDSFLKKYFSYVKENGFGDTNYIYENLNAETYIGIDAGILVTDGTYIGIHQSDSSCALNGYVGDCATTIIDVNGDKGPNRIGYDVFNITLRTDKITPFFTAYSATHSVNTSCIEPPHAGWDGWTNKGNGCLNRILLNTTKWSG